MPALLVEAYSVAVAADRASAAEDNVLPFPGRENSRDQGREGVRKSVRPNPRVRGAKKHRE
ncbi:MAG: hypothetical protein CMM48_05510 [Rhodospirillaceae bacterium]|nr:hypothetical protein [Rhodospirillaceae bacterium]|tara:strand:+ start:227 stop:409 length:183 start_codon:yes stop_codon:yes gene_type:complete